MTNERSWKEGAIKSSNVTKSWQTLYNRFLQRCLQCYTLRRHSLEDHGFKFIHPIANRITMSLKTH